VPGERETVQLADGYSVRGDTLARIAGRLSGTPQEQEYLIRAGDAYRQALALYVKVINFGNAATNLRNVQRDLSQVEQRLADLSQAAIESHLPQNFMFSPAESSAARSTPPAQVER
jgi:hypothetical protein